MANKTRTEILAQIYAYLPHINQTSKSTLVNNCIDLALERISHRHNFRCFRAKTPDSATLAKNAYYLDTTAFTTAFGASGYFKDVLDMRLMVSGASDYTKITFIDDNQFHNDYGYVDLSAASHGAPSRYTILNDRWLFNCPADKAYSVRIWYQQYHPPFASDATSHSFYARDNYLAFNAIVYQSLVELKNSLVSIEPLDADKVMELAERNVNELIARDMNLSNEEQGDLLGWAEKRTSGGVNEDPYGWV